MTTKPDRAKAPATEPFHPCHLPEIEHMRHAGGATLHSFSGGSEAVSVLTLVFGGGASESSSALRELYPTMLAEGTSSLSSADIADRMDLYGARPAFRMTDHFTTLQIWMLNRNAGPILGLLADILADASFPDDKLARTKLIAKSRLAIGREKVSVRAAESATAMIAGADHPSAHVLTDAEIDAVTSADLADLHSRIRGAGNCHAYLGGLLDSDVTMAVRHLLDSLPCCDGEMPLNIKPFNAEPPHTVHISMPRSVQAGLCVALPAIPRCHPDYLPLRIAVMALGGYFGSRLMSNLREKEGITYGISSYLNGSLDGSAVYIAAQCASDKVDLAVEQIAAEMINLADKPPVSDEMERLRLNLSTAALAAIDTPAGVIGQYVTERTVGLPEGYFDRQQELVSNLTPEIIADAARRYLRPELMRTAIASADKSSGW